MSNLDPVESAEHAVASDADSPAANPNELLSRDQIQREYGITRRWLELAAVRGDGPQMLRLSWKMVRYKRADLEAWLRSREVRSTSEPIPAEEA